MIHPIDGPLPPPPVPEDAPEPIGSEEKDPADG